MMAERYFLVSEHTDRARILPARERYVGGPDITYRSKTALFHLLARVGRPTADM